MAQLWSFRKEKGDLQDRPCQYNLLVDEHQKYQTAVPSIPYRIGFPLFVVVASYVGRKLTALLRRSAAFLLGLIMRDR